MLGQLGPIIDKVYNALSKGTRPTKRLVFIVGNGIRHVSNILNDDQVKIEAAKRGYKPGTVDFDNFKWRLFEYARYHTANTLATFAHCCIHRMVTDRACGHVITTNYDLFFDSIWQKCPLLNVARNPVAKKNEYLWDAYYSYQRKSSQSPCYWKIHGSLSHGVFRGKTSKDDRLLVSLPRFAIPTNQPEIAKAYGLDTTSPFLGYEASENPGTAFPDHLKLDPTFQPFIDWMFHDRKIFDREIAGAKAVLSDVNKIEAIILLGFRGYFNRANPADPWNEELVLILDKLLGSGFDNIFMAVDDRQYATRHEAASEFMRNRFSAGKADRYTDVGKFMRDLLSRYSLLFPYALVDSEYAKWANYFYASTPEGTHV